MMYRLFYTKQAVKDSRKIVRAGLKQKVQKLLKVIQSHPFQNPLPYEKLVGDLKGAYSRRITIQHRLIYQIYEKERIIKIIRMWTHYE
jgi:toxin YoeB